MAEWIKRDHSKGAIDRAGALLIPWWRDGTSRPEGLGAAYVTIQNWRSSHAMPLLTFRMGLEQRARRIDLEPIVAQRLKRFSSVMNKLVREPKMKLSQMQDWSLSTRKRNPLEQTTIDNRQYALDKWIYPFFEGRFLADVNNRAMKELVEKMARKLSASSISEHRQGRCRVCDQRKRGRTVSAQVE